jgi:hypothetical protein
MKKAELLPFTVRSNGLEWSGVNKTKKRKRGIERLLYEIYDDSRSE